MNPSTSLLLVAAHPSARLSFALFGMIALLGCEGLGSEDGPPDGPGGPGSDVGQPDPRADWTLFSTPCVGNRTNALHVHSDGRTLLVGCGENADGEGLFRSSDGGTTFATVPGTERFRVNDLRTSDDGWLYAAGTSTSNAARVVRLSDGGRGATIETVLEAGSLAGESFSVGRFVRLPGGAAIAESLTGSDLACRASDGDEWTFRGPQDWTAAGAITSSQILDLTVFEGEVWGSGARISEPPVLYRPVPDPAGPCLFERVEVDPDIRAEAWGLAVVSQERVVLGGFSSELSQGLLWVATGDPSTVTNWERIRVDDFFGEPSLRPTTWIRDVCTNGRTVVAVGEQQPLRQGNAVALLSVDGGSNWRALAVPSAPSTLTVCSVDAAGTITAAGSGGWLGVFR